MPDVLHIEATGLGGRDLGYPERWDLSLRSDPEGQQVYALPLQMSRSLPWRMMGAVERALNMSLPLA